MTDANAGPVGATRAWPDQRTTRGERGDREAAQDVMPAGTARALAELARELEAECSASGTLARITHAATELIPGAEQASISVVLDRHCVESKAASAAMAAQVDAAHTETGQGPCLDSIFEHRTVRVDDLASETRWPEFARRACLLGTRSMLSFQLFVEADNLGALNLFSSKSHAFTQESETVGLLFAAHAAVAFAGIQTHHTLAAAVRTSSERTAELQRLTTELARRNDDLRRFAYLASHDLQAPLRTVGGFTEILAASLGRQDLTEDQSALIASILGGVGDMHRMIKGLLEYNKLQTRAGSFVSIRSCHDSIAATLADEISAAGATVTMVGPDQETFADPIQLQLLLFNLVHNSITHRSLERPVIVTTTAQSTAGGGVAMLVRDNGVGIAPQHRARVFEMFQTLRKGSGTGIGLAIVARIVELHEGTIDIEGDGTTGSTFRIWLPAPPALIPV